MEGKVIMSGSSDEKKTSEGLIDVIFVVFTLTSWRVSVGTYIFIQVLGTVRWRP
jgi:hypothetical protein